MTLTDWHPSAIAALIAQALRPSIGADLADVWAGIVVSHWGPWGPGWYA